MRKINISVIMFVIFVFILVLFTSCYSVGPGLPGGNVRIVNNTSRAIDKIIVEYVDHNYKCTNDPHMKRNFPCEYLPFGPGDVYNPFFNVSTEPGCGIGYPPSYYPRVDKIDVMDCYSFEERPDGTKITYKATCKDVTVVFNGVSPVTDPVSCDLTDDSVWQETDEDVKDFLY